MDRTVLKEKVTSTESNRSHAVVLCHLPDNRCTPFVTWCRTYESDGSQSDYWGHYHRDIVEATTDFEERS